MLEYSDNDEHGWEVCDVNKNPAIDKRIVSVSNVEKMGNENFDLHKFENSLDVIDKLNKYNEIDDEVWFHPFNDSHAVPLSLYTDQTVFSWKDVNCNYRDSKNDFSDITECVDNLPDISTRLPNSSLPVSCTVVENVHSDGTIVPQTLLKHVTPTMDHSPLHLKTPISAYGTNEGSHKQIINKAYRVSKPLKELKIKVEGSPYSMISPSSAVSDDDDNEGDEFYRRFKKAFMPNVNNDNDNFEFGSYEKASDYEESVYEQLINDGPLLEALNKKLKRGSYKCIHCPQDFPDIFAYAKHLDEYNIKRKYKCPFNLCQWKILGLPRQHELRRHCINQHKNEIPDSLKHLLNFNELNFPVLSCPSPYCDKVFHRKDSHARHISMVHDNNDSRFNKRLKKVLQTCPSTDDPENIQYIKTLMSTKRKKINRH